jgi:hypothetical protein
LVFPFFCFYVFIYLFIFYFLFQKDYIFFNMVYNENNFLKILYFCLIRCRSPPALPWPTPGLALPCPALPCPAVPCPALAPAVPYFEFSFCCQGQEEEVTQGQEEEVTQGTFFPFVARDRRKLHRERAVLFFLLLPRTGGRNYTGNGQLPGTAHIDRHQTYRHVALICRIHCKSPNGCK